MSNLYRPPSQRGSNFPIGQKHKYKPPNLKTKPPLKRSANAQWVGASILLFSTAPDGYIYFLLGQEVFQEGYKDSGKWSDFGGGAQSYEDEYTCAAREFLEETQRTINPFPKKYGHSLPDMFMITQELRNQNYTARIDFNFVNTRHLRTYTTFLVEIPWDPTLKPRFAKRVRTATNHSFPSTNRYTNFQGKLASKRSSVCEKRAIEYFSIPALVDSGLFGNDNSRSHPEAPQKSVSSDAPVFRPFFKRRVSKVLALAFPKNLAQYRTLDDSEACRALYQGSGVHVPLARRTSTRKTNKWSRGTQVPPQWSAQIGDQPPSRIFQNFNTHRKYMPLERKDPVDKIFY